MEISGLPPSQKLSSSLPLDSLDSLSASRYVVLNGEDIGSTIYLWTGEKLSAANLGAVYNREMLAGAAFEPNPLRCRLPEQTGPAGQRMEDGAT